MLSCDQPSRGSDFLPSEEAAVMSDLTFLVSHLDFFLKLQLPKYLRINRKYKENCKNQMASWSALEPPSWIRLRGGCLQPPQLSRRLGTLKELWNSLKKLAPALRNLYFPCSSWPGTWAPLSLAPGAPQACWNRNLGPFLGRPKSSKTMVFIVGVTIFLEFAQSVGVDTGPKFAS